MPSYRRRRRRDLLPVELDVNGALSATIGADGLSTDEIDTAAVAVERARAALLEAQPGFVDFAQRRVELQQVQELSVSLLGRYDAVVVFGAGASAVGARLLGSVRPSGRIRRPRLVVADSIDPSILSEQLARLDLRRTLFNVVSQSGDAAETMAQFMIVRDRLLRELGAVDYREHVVITTDAERGSLRQIVNDEGFRDLPIPADAPGAFGLLSPVGLFPAAMTGVDVEELFDGAQAMAERCRTAVDARQDPAALLALIWYLLRTRRPGRPLAMIPYSAALMSVAEWASQLWPTPIGMLRHTELMRHHDDAHFGERVLLMLRPTGYATELSVPVAYQDLADVGYLGGRSLGDILVAEADGAAVLLAKRGHPSVQITVPAASPGGLGQFIHLLQRAAALVAILDGQPPGHLPDGDEARRIVGSSLARAGTEAEAAAVAAWRARKDSRYIL